MPISLRARSGTVSHGTLVLLIGVGTACLVLCGIFPGMCISESTASQPNPYFGIHVVDADTGRGVPLVELETVNNLRFVTDSAGWVAFHEPGLMGRRVFFHVHSHGYEFPKDSFGYAGIALTPTPGGKATIRLKRVNIAERLYRVTGEGIYRDSILLGEPTPLAEPLGAGKVAGQDSVSAVPYRGKIYWFWGDTNKMDYPLGHFWMAGAISDPPERGGLDPAVGVKLRYFTDKDGFSRPVCRLSVERGPIWADAFAVLPDDAGRQSLVCHYVHVESLGKILDHGLAIYNDEKEEFERLKELDMRDLWRFPQQAHPVRHRDGGVEYLYLGEVFPTIRVPARLNALTDLDRYEGWTCLVEGAAPDEPQVDRSPDGTLRYRWRRGAKPMTTEAEQKLIADGLIKPEEARLSPKDVDSGKLVRLHRGSVAWNAYRKRWILIACEVGGSSSHLGEIWYSEAPDLTGPWRLAKKIVTHNQYSFYNPVHHPFFDQAGGRFIYFEGTYTVQFSGNKHPTPRYEYNQVMYRLDLEDPRLKAVQLGQ